ncbi:hypothetical protein M0638_20685 [Roseomonas sp. NAR14]|uniref:Secreted protein n=1 Tax=Roseomonas acroporae TaxID=2937791 RepID=A0A9X2BVK4_9PROT|nr:hypothetical protein [Roseomonas acroporae]MCK8786792.1 hypothetical protein [Roseomonas acroporae]
MGRCARIGAGLLAGWLVLAADAPVRAQQPCCQQQPAYQGQQPWQAPTPYGQPAPGYQGGAPGAAPNLAGAWSGARPVGGGVAQGTEYYGPDGNLLAVARLPNGVFIRLTARYTVSPAGPGVWRIDTRLTSVMPQRICHRAPGMADNCQPFQVPPASSSLVRFVAPDTLAVQDLATGTTATESRDPNPVMLQQQVPPLLIVNEAPPAPMQGGMPGPAPVVPYRPMARGAQCDDLQQRRLCAINNGHFIQSNGCMVCVTD